MKKSYMTRVALAAFLFCSLTAFDAHTLFALDFEISILSSTNGRAELVFSNQVGKTYRILFSANPGTNVSSWRSLTNLIGTNGLIRYPIQVSATKMFYAVEERPRPLFDMSFYVDPNSDAQRWASSHISSDPTNANLMQKVADSATALWLASSQGNYRASVSNRMDWAHSIGQIPIFVLYNIVHRDCGNYSAGGAQNATEYTNWVRSIAQSIGSRSAIVILEPDALAGIDCLALTKPDRDERITLMRSAIDILKSESEAIVYVDVGHSNWQQYITMIDLLKRVEAEKCDGFSLNVANFQFDANTIKYGEAISKVLDDLHFVIDTSRNGLGPYTKPNDPEYWCNPPGRALGRMPTSDTWHPLVDAFLWIKVPGESDGSCRNGPPAGVFWPDYALGLAAMAAY